jgi:hypothetical protein
MMMMDYQMHMIIVIVLLMMKNLRIVHMLIEQVDDLFFRILLKLISILGVSQADPDNDWKPNKKVRHSDENDDEDNSSDESELNLLKQEAAEFVLDSSPNHQRSAKKKARVHIPDDDD